MIAERLQSARLRRIPTVENKFVRGLFVTGTDTDVGKTWISCLIANTLRANGVRRGAYKPACSGCEVDSEGETYWPDIRALGNATGNSFPEDRLCPQRFKEPLAPPVAAAAEHSCVDAELLRTGVNWWRVQVDCLLVEGVGGLLCPLTTDGLVVDLAVDLAMPLLVVARPNLGTINHTLLTIEAAKQRGLGVVGVVLNQPIDQSIDASFVASNAEQIERFGQVRVLGFCPHGSDTLVSLTSQQPIRTDWLSLFGCAE